MAHLTELHFKAETLNRYGLPDIAYPIPVADLQSILLEQGELPLAIMLHGLQQRSRDGNADWQQMEPAMDRLALLVAPDDTREIIPAAGDTWWLEIGPVDLGSKLVTIQRDEYLIAAISPREDGRLRVAVFRPLDGKSAASLINLGLLPHPEHGVCMRENNWEYALDGSAGAGNYYAADRGEAYLSFWEKGLGVSWDDSVLPDWFQQRSLAPRPAAQVAMELGIYYSLYQDEDLESTPTAETTGAEEIEPPTEASWHSRRQQTRTVEERFLGCLLGGAVGDALGAPVEFMQRSEILRRFGPDGITEYAPAYGGLGTITDDTQMTLFTAEGLIRGWVRYCFKGVTDYTGVTAHAYLRWLQTQGDEPSFDLRSFAHEPGWLFQQHELHQRRAPGNTCLSALQVMSSLGEPACNDSKGCGGVMRVAPVGLFAWRLRKSGSPRETFKLGAELAALTHGHPTGALTAGLLSVLIMALTDGATLPEALAAAKIILREHRDHEETLHAVEMAEILASSGLPHEQAIARLGEGWVAEEALAIAIYCALVARDFRHGVILAVNHDGDSDSTGSIVGNLLGAMHGVKAIPAEWLEPLELRDVITELARDLYAFNDWNIGPYSSNNELNQQIWQKYPGF